jgi:dGTPase
MSNLSLKHLAINDNIDNNFTKRLYHDHENKFLIKFFNSAFAIDRNRIVCSSAFRRLQYKTQVFVNHQGDHFRTRLTHTLEVAQIARAIAFALDLNQDLAETISLIHDLGHPPFGHAGEEVLNYKMKNFGGFSHNTHTLKIITKIENYCAKFNGLNLTIATLEGVSKHNGTIDKNTQSHLDKYFVDFNKTFDLSLDKNPSLEAQISAIADDIAYNNHDIEDGIRAGLIMVEELLSLPLIGDIYRDLICNNATINNKVLVGEAKTIITKVMIDDVIINTYKNINIHNIKNIDDIKNHPSIIVDFSENMMNINQQIKFFLNRKMYRHDIVNQMTKDAHITISKIFDHLFNNPKKLPKEFYEKYLLAKNDNNLAEIICDYIAGMTDRFAIKFLLEIVD